MIVTKEFFKGCAIILFGFLISIIFASNMESEVLSVEYIGNNPNVEMTIQHKRVNRGKYGISAAIILKEDLTNDYLIESVVYRNTGNNQYTKTPYGSALGKLNLKKFMNKIYKPYIMKSFKGCSNFSQFDNEFEPPVAAGYYYFDSCFVNDEELPSFLTPGQYKLDVTFTKSKIQSKLIGVIKIVKKT